MSAALPRKATVGEHGKLIHFVEYASRNTTYCGRDARLHFVDAGDPVSCKRCVAERARRNPGELVIFADLMRGFA